MRIREVFRCFLWLLLACAGITAAHVLPMPLNAFFLKGGEQPWVRDGIQMEIRSVDFHPPTVSVTFRISDEQGGGLDRRGVDTPGPVDFAFLLARIKPGDLQYTNYITEPATSHVTGVTAHRPSQSDAGGTYVSLGDGVYKFTFGFQFPVNFEKDSTHTLNIRAIRDLKKFDLGLARADAFYDFVPSGKPVTQVRDVVREENCNRCHNSAAKVRRNGASRNPRRCILCHYPGIIDPATGNSLDFKVVIHKIHRGVNLPSVKAGQPFQIYNFAQKKFLDYSTVAWPQDVRNCMTCHQKATQRDNHRTNPSRAACGSCHDNVDFASGNNHPGGVQADDSKCKSCHVPDSGREFDLSVDGAHTIPEYSKQLQGLNAKILGVSHTNPGERVTMSFTITDNAGNLVDLSKLEALNLVLAGPTTDYTWRVDAGDGRQAQRAAAGYSFTFPEALPKDASGTYAVAIRAVRNVTVRGVLHERTAQESALNPVFYFGVAGTPVVPRRKVVDIEKCKQCHKDLAIGRRGLGRNPEYCVLCHNPKFTDAERRPKEDMPAETMSFRTMVHRIHMGTRLPEEYTVYTANKEKHRWKENRFPGEQRDCATCHLGDAYKLPLPEGLASTDAPRFFYTPLGPAASACLGCHNGKQTASHAYQMTSPFGESCDACHGEGLDYAVSKVHAP